MLYLLYEHVKGEQSFWKPYLDLMPDVKFFCHWTDELIVATQDMNLMQYATEYKQELHEEWTKLAAVMAKHPSVFPHSSIEPQLFFKFYA